MATPAGIILCMCPANEGRRYNVTSSLIGWVHTKNDANLGTVAPIDDLVPNGAKSSAGTASSASGTAKSASRIYSGDCNMPNYFFALQWRHNRRDGVPNHQPHDCLLNWLFRRRSKKTSKVRVTGFVRGIHRWPVNSPHKWPVTRKMFQFDVVIMQISLAIAELRMVYIWLDDVI